MKRKKTPSPPPLQEQATGFLARLGALKRPIVAVASVGAVLSGMVGYYTTYKTVASVQTQPAKPTPIQAGPSIAVLPFADMSQAHDQEYFSDGIAEELLNLLAKVPQLHVTARTSSFSFKGKNVEIKEIANKLGVAHVLEGSVRRSGDTLRITVQLIRASDSFHVWSETYDRKIDDIFKVQDEIASAVVGQLKVKLLAATPTATAIDPKAYALILKGNYVANQHTPQATRQAIDFYRQAIAISPEAVAAWNGLAKAHMNEFDFGDLSPRDGFPKVRQAAQQALRFDPNSASAEAILGWIDILADYNFASAAVHYERAMTHTSSNPDVLDGYARFLFAIGKNAEALEVLRYWTSIDPANTENHFFLSLLNLYEGNLQASQESARTVLSLNPDFPMVRQILGLNELRQGRLQQGNAIMEAERAEFARPVGLALSYYSMGRKAESDAELAKAIQRSPQAVAVNVAHAYAYRGDTELAFKWLDKAVQFRDSGIFVVIHDQAFEPMRKDPRWTAMLRQIGIAPEQVAALKFNYIRPSTGTPP